MTARCRAKYPDYCPYHGKRQYALTEGYIERLKASLPKAQDYTEHEDIVREIEEKKRYLDATAVGFKKLQKELKNAMRFRDVEEQAYYANRIAAAAEQRKKDGEELLDPWNRAETHEAVMKLVNQEIEQGQLILPSSQAGTQSVLYIAHSLVEQGHEIVDVHMYKQGNHEDGKASDEERAFAAKLLTEKNSVQTVMKFAFDFDYEDPQRRTPYSFFARGFTLKTPEGKVIESKVRFGDEVTAYGDPGDW